MSLTAISATASKGPAEAGASLPASEGYHGLLTRELRAGLRLVRMVEKCPWKRVPRAACLGCVFPEFLVSKLCEWRSAEGKAEQRHCSSS